MQILQILGKPSASRLFRPAALSLALAGALLADRPTAKPHPQGFGSAPAPSSLVLVLAGLAGLLIWNWWRGRARGERTSSE
ncbi:MAG TPA: hypothetical protein VFW44_08810 [Bryobacteraceae bacterium]|nr:hypothetical protein [Bryobacteraceae bacterium]